jgi:3-oxoacyl-(acyl-carrier-protein) synthase III
VEGRAAVAARIAGTSHLLPGRPVTTEELVERLPEARDPAQVVARTGIAVRHLAEPGTPAAETSARVLGQALEDAGMTPGELETVVFVDSSCGDHAIPATSNLVAAALGLADQCGCFDLNNACMGFLSALDVAGRFVATGSGPVGIVVCEMGSRITTPDDPRPYLVFGDAAAAVVVDAAREGEAILGSSLRNDGSEPGMVMLDHGTFTGSRETIRFGATNDRMAGIAVDLLRRRAGEVLDAAGLSIDDVDWVLPHQPNGALLDAIVAALSIPKERLVPVVREIGSVGAASIPVSLAKLMASGRVRPGERLLMIGVGAGLSSGAMLYRTGARSGASS